MQVPRDVLSGSSEVATMVPTRSSRRILDLGVPVATMTEREGVALDVGSARVGLSAGFRSSGAIDLPSGSDIVLFIRARGGSSFPPDVILGKDLE